MTKLLTPKFRVSFPCVFEAKAFADQKPKFSIVMLWNIADLKKDPTSIKQWKTLRDAVATATVEKWGKKIPKNLKLPFRKGEEKEGVQGYGEGVVFATASSKMQPGVVDQSLQRIISPEEFYAGCYAQATVNTFCWEMLGKAGVSFGLQNIQKIADGEPFSGRSKPEDDFDAITTVAGDDDKTFEEDMFE